MDPALQRQLQTMTALLAAIAAAQVYQTVFGPFTGLPSGFSAVVVLLVTVGFVVGLLAVAANQAVRALAVETLS